MSIDYIKIPLQPTGSFLVDIIVWLVKITSSVALGVVLFTVLLKLITLIPDFISRKSMRKNSLKMEEMRPELEKLQKQYADNKDLYNQKMMALYKKNGYSMFGACIPTIITLVIFFIAIAAFNNYSNYQNYMYYYDMGISYNSVIFDGIDQDNDIIKINDEGLLIVDNERAINLDGKDVLDINGNVLSGKKYSVDVNTTGDEKFYTLSTGSYTTYKCTFTETEGVKTFNHVSYLINQDKLADSGLVNKEGQSFADGGDAVAFVKSVCAEKAADTFRNNGSRFLWVANIWQPDTSTAHPVSDAVFQSRNSSCGCGSCDSCNKSYGSQDVLNQFDDLTAGLSEEKEAPNGYFILVALTALSSLFLQWVTSKSQKAQMDLQTVNGQGAQQQKMMMWMMPIMMAFFSFLYTAAFSIYIILSSLISMVTTLGINAIVDKQYNNAKTTTNQVVRGRVYTPKKEEKPAEPKKKKKKKDEIPEIDFLRASADKKSKRK